MSAEQLITDHLDLWTSAVTYKSSRGAGKSRELIGIKKLRELILELAVRGKLVEQDPSDEPASVLLEKIAEKKARLVKEGKIKKPKKLPAIAEEDKPFELPNGWQWARLSDTLRVINGRAYKKHEMLQVGTPLLRVGNLFTSKEWYYSDLQLEDDKYIDHGDLIYAWSASFGPFIWEGGKTIYHYHIWKLELFDYFSTNKYFLYNYLKAVTDEIKSSGSGIAMIHMTKAKMEELVIPFPPLDEQHRIVTRVDELMALCDQLEQQTGDQLDVHEVLVDTLLDALTRAERADEVAAQWARLAEHFDTLFTTEASIDKLKQAILQLAVMGRLVEQDPNDEPASVLLEKIAEEKARLVKEGKIKKPKNSSTKANSPSFSLPRNWSWAKWDDVCEKIGDIDHKMPPTSKEGYPYVSPRDFLPENGINYSGAKKISKSDFERLSNKIQPQKGDLIYPRYGTIGENRLIESEVEFLASYSCAVIKPLKNFIIPKYFYFISLSSLTRHQAKDAENKTTQANVGIASIKNFILSLPPKVEQQRIVAKVDELMALCDQLKVRLSDASETCTHLAEAVVTQAVE